MRPNLVRTSFLAFTFVAIASFGGILTAVETNLVQAVAKISS